jgi:thioredoxin reductase (NADPH)
MANLAEKIENYPGFEGSGRELMQKFYEQAEKFGTKFLNSEVTDFEKDRTGFVTGLKNGKAVHSKTLIIASGTEKRKLNVKGEEDFVGRGVSYCTVCDAPLFKNKVVAVIGGRNSAAKASLILSNIAKKVYVVYRQNKLNADKADIERIIKKKNIELTLNSVPIEIKGENAVNSLLIEQQGKRKELKLNGVFIEIGSVPPTKILKKLGVKTDKEGYIIVDKDMKTNVKGIYAAGDAVKSKLKQVVVSAAHGAIAAKSAFDFLSKKDSAKSSRTCEL